MTHYQLSRFIAAPARSNVHHLSHINIENSVICVYKGQMQNVFPLRSSDERRKFVCVMLFSLCSARLQGCPLARHSAMVLACTALCNGARVHGHSVMVLTCTSTLQRSNACTTTLKGVSRALLLCKSIVCTPTLQGSIACTTTLQEYRVHAYSAREYRVPCSEYRHTGEQEHDV